MAGALKEYDRNGFLFLAAGISDSNCKTIDEFERESKLVREAVANHTDKLFVFFSTFSINDPMRNTSHYVLHKLAMEQYVEEYCANYLIVRVSNLVGAGGNPKNVFNFFYNHIVSQRSFSLWANAKRNLITADDFAKVLNYIIENELHENRNSIVNIINSRNFTVQEIVHAIELKTGIAAIYKLEQIESEPHLNDEHATQRLQKLGIDTENYLNKILNSYFNKPVTNLHLPGRITNE